MSFHLSKKGTDLLRLLQCLAFSSIGFVQITVKQEVNWFKVSGAVVYSTNLSTSLVIQLRINTKEWVDDDHDISHTTVVILAPLPGKLALLILNGLMMIRGTLKDLKLTWTSDKPVWWPSDISFQNITLHLQIKGIDISMTLMLVVWLHID